MYRTTVTLTIFSILPIDGQDIRAAIKDTIHLGDDSPIRDAVVGVDPSPSRRLTDDELFEQLWTYGFEPTVLEDQRDWQIGQAVRLW